MKYPELERSIEVIKKLHHPTEGCPWDLEQTHESLLKYLLEESYEFIEAVELKDPKMMEEEIGDILLQVLHHTTMGEKQGKFDIESAAKRLADKMIHRHPHVFGDKKNLKPDEVVEKWKDLKSAEKKEDKKYSITKKALYAPALTGAKMIGEKSTTVNFDWDDYYQVIMKVEEEWQEVKEELPPGGHFNKGRVKEELGDLLFSVAQLARHLGIDAEDALRDANKKFIKRFQKVEDEVWRLGKTMPEMPQAELEKIWVKVKKQ